MLAGLAVTFSSAVAVCPEIRASSGETADTPALYTDTNRYSTMAQEYKDKGYPLAKNRVLPDNFLPASSGEVEMTDGYHGYDGPVVTWEKSEDWLEWTFTVSESALYCIRMEYLLGENGDAAVRSLLLDGEEACRETNEISFFGVYRDDYSEGKRYNAYGDEVRPKALSVRRWQSMFVEDSTGVTPSPLMFYLEAGQHVIRLDYVSSSMYIRQISLEPPRVVPDYSTYRADGPDVETFGETLTFEAEEFLERNTTTLRVETHTDAGCQPECLKTIKMNTMGGWQWRTAGQSCTWEIEVPQDGYYQIGMRVLQEWKEGLPSYRKIMINGEVPFSELYAYEIPYDKNWSTVTLSDKDGKPYEIYLKQGKNTITMTPVAGESGLLMGSIETYSEMLSDFLLELLTIVGQEPDYNYDYELDKAIPDILEKIDRLLAVNSRCMDQLTLLSDERSSLSSSLSQADEVLSHMRRDLDIIPRKIDEVKTLQASLSSTYLTLREQPVQMDYILVGGNGSAYPSPRTNFFVNAYRAIANFIYSFTRDYSGLGAVQPDGTPVHTNLSVWCGSGKEWALLIQELANERFTTATGIGIEMNILPSNQLNSGSVNALMLAISSGEVPDVVIGVSPQTPGEFAIREAVVDLSQLEGYNTFKDEFLEPVLLPLQFEGGQYGLPETMNFNALFYRRDIFEKYGFKLPETWDDVYNTLLPALYQKSMDMFIPNDLAMFLYQHQGAYYNDSFTASGLDTPEAYQAFKELTELFTNYDIEVTADFYNRFRTGEMPVGIGSYWDYIKLMVAAPELTGKWGIALVPGTRQPDGSVDHSFGNLVGTADILLEQSQKPAEGWDFLRWWMDEETQYEYVRRVDAIIGREGRVNTANYKAFYRLPWNKSDLDVIKEAMQWGKETPSVLGGYFTSRHVTNAWNRTVISGMNVRDSLELAVEEINKEIDFKRKEYGRE